MTELVIKKNKIEVPNWFLKNYQLLEENNNGALPDLLKSVRKDAYQKLIDIGFPTQKVEDWKYTAIHSIIEKNFKLSNLSDAWKDQLIISKVHNLIEQNHTITNLSPNIITFIDGHFIETLSKIHKSEEIIISNIKKILKENPETISNYLNKYNQIENGFNALNDIFFDDGILVQVKDNTVEDNPIVIVYVQSNSDELIINPRNLIIVGNNSKVRVVEFYISLDEAKSFTNTISEIFVAENSYLEHYKFHNESLKCYHVGKIQAHLERNSNLTSHNFSFGGAITRNDINIILDGEGAEGHMYGLYFAKDKQHVDNHTLVDHAKPHCFSNEFYKGILTENSRGVFNGKIIVRKGSQKTNAYQSNKNLLLSGNAKIDTKPQLEIFADDVKCTHGATVGQVDDDALFYLRARCIDEKTAKTLLVNAFANDVLSNITFEPLKERIDNFILNKMKELL